jgi:drug/metabolite transporter (DMT)-like permease
MNQEETNKSPSSEEAPKKQKITILSLLFIQGAVIVYTGSDICSKFTSHYQAFSGMWLFFVFLELVCLGSYAILWQQIIKRFDLSIAYANRATAIFWSMLWSILIFREGMLSVKNIICVLVVFSGVLLVNQDAG